MATAGLTYQCSRWWYNISE